jgi:hypothetical protein
MKLEDEILVNKFGQGLVAVEQLTERFGLLEVLKKKEFLNDFLYLIMQSKPKKEDIEPAIIDSSLKSTFTPCVLLRKGVGNHDLEKLVNLPENELTRAFVLLLSLFKIAYNRRFTVEKNSPDKWWYWDLSDDKAIETIMKL